MTILKKRVSGQPSISLSATKVTPYMNTDHKAITRQVSRTMAESPSVGVRNSFYDEIN